MKDLSVGFHRDQFPAVVARGTDHIDLFPSDSVCHRFRLGGGDRFMGRAPPVVSGRREGNGVSGYFRIAARTLAQKTNPLRRG